MGEVIMDFVKAALRNVRSREEIEELRKRLEALKGEN